MKTLQRATQLAGSQKGAAAALLAILLPVFVAVLGLIVDVGNLHARKRQAQTAADATAMAAAHELRKQNVSTYDDEAIKDAVANGFQSDDKTKITVNRPPTSGPVSGDSNFVEVVITQEAPLLFMRMFGRDAATVQVRAVAGLVDRDVCTYILDGGSSGALYVHGNGILDQSACSVQVNSDHAYAAETSGVGQVAAAMVSVVGNYSGTGFYPTPEISAAVIDDPLEDLEPPTFSGCDHAETVIVEDSQTLSPGVYCGGIEVRANGHATLSSGQYIINGGGLTVGGSCNPCSSGGSGGSGGGCGGGSGGSSMLPSGLFGDGGPMDMFTSIEQNLRSTALAAITPRSAHADSSSGGSGGSSEPPSCTPAQLDGDDVSFYFTGNGSCGSPSGGGGSGGGSGSSMLPPGLFGEGGSLDLFTSIEKNLRSTALAAITPRSAHADSSGGSGGGGSGGSSCASYAGIHFKEEADVYLTPPTSGTYSGVLFFDDPALSSGSGHKIEDDATVEITGVAYFPNLKLTVEDNADVDWHSMTLVTSLLEIDGNGSVTEIDRSASLMSPVALDASLRE